MLEKEIFNIKSEAELQRLAIEVFRFQYGNVRVYRNFCDLLNTKISEVKTIAGIPFLPIQFFKSHKILAENSVEETVFTSSGTTGSINSRHYVSDIGLYETSFLNKISSFS